MKFGSSARFRETFLKATLPLTVLLFLAGAYGFFLGKDIQLKLSLTDLLPEDHAAVVKFNKLTEVVGGVGYLTVILSAPDGASHQNVAPQLVADLRKSPLVRNAYYEREKRFFVDRLLYYLEVDKLKDLESNIHKEIRTAKRKVFDLGLFDEEEKKSEPVFNNELTELAQTSARITSDLISKDSKHLLIMIKPSFDSLEMQPTKDLIKFTEETLKRDLPSGVTYEMAGRYYSKVIETEMIEGDIYFLGSLSLALIALILFASLRSVRSLVVIFVPVVLGLGITFGLTRLFIGHINIVTGFLIGIVSGLGVDYGIHLVLRLKLERKEPSSSIPDPVWRTLASSGHSVAVGAIAASFSFYLLCFSEFKAFSEFGFVCGTGIASVLICLLITFSPMARLLRLDKLPIKEIAAGKIRVQFPVLGTKRAFYVGVAATIILAILATRVGFEYDFDKMMKHSEKMDQLFFLVEEIQEQSSIPSALSVPDKAEALEVEKYIKKNYMPKLVNEMISGASIVPENQAEKQLILARIKKDIDPLKNGWIEKSLGVPASAVRRWVAAAPFTFNDLPSHIQDAMRGTQKTGFLIYIYPAILLNTATNVRTYANMIRDVETKFPNVLTGSDAVIFSDILDLIKRDGTWILAVIFISIGIFIWLSVRDWTDTMLSYFPLIVSLPVGMGLMYVFGIKFNILNIAIIPTFVAMGIDVPIHIVHRSKEVRSGFKAARDLAASINLALITAGIGFGVLIFARAGVLKSLGWIALLGTLAIWWVGMFLLPAFLERHYRRQPTEDGPESEGLTPATSAEGLTLHPPEK